MRATRSFRLLVGCIVMLLLNQCRSSRNDKTMVISYGKIFLLDKNSGQAANNAEEDAPALQTIVVRHNECTECGDFELDSGAVIIPLKLRSQYVKANARWYSRFNGGWDGSVHKTDSVKDIRSQEAKLKLMRYRLYTVRLASESAFDSLFLLPGRTRDDTIKNSAGNVYPWDFNRRYRATVEVVGLEGRYLAVRVHKAVRLPDRKD